MSTEQGQVEIQGCLVEWRWGSPDVPLAVDEGERRLDYVRACGRVVCGLTECSAMCAVSTDPNDDQEVIETVLPGNRPCISRPAKRSIKNTTSI